MEGAALDVDFDLDVAEAAEGEAEEMGVGILDVAAVETGKGTVTDFDDGVGGEGVLGEFEVALTLDAFDGLAEALEVVVRDLGQLEATSRGAGHGTLREEELDIGVMADVFVGNGLLHAADEEHAGDEVAQDHALGAVGIDVQHLLARNVGLPRGCGRVLPQVFDTSVGIFLVGQQGHEPLAAGYGRATRFVHSSTYRSARRNYAFVHIVLQRYEEFFN